MKLLTKQIIKTLPPIGAQNDIAEPVAHVKFFTPDNSWTWFITEGQLELDEADNEIDFLFFGRVHGDATEWGYFKLGDLLAFRGPLGLPIERDLCFKPTVMNQLKKGQHYC